MKWFVPLTWNVHLSPIWGRWQRVSVHVGVVIYDRFVTRQTMVRTWLRKWVENFSENRSTFNEFSRKIIEIFGGIFGRKCLDFRWTRKRENKFKDEHFFFGLAGKCTGGKWWFDCWECVTSMRLSLSLSLAMWAPLERHHEHNLLVHCFTEEMLAFRLNFETRWRRNARWWSWTLVAATLSLGALAFLL